MWYAANGRDLPWRRTKDPYRIWISEIILQQTRVDQGTEYYNRFIKRFPSVEALAFASTDDVMRQWEGLGYYSRARNLHAAARQVVEQGSFPQSYEAVRALKGIGDYTAAAICSFAYDMAYAVVDGNVFRVLSRYYGIDTPIDATAGKREFSQLAKFVLDERHPAMYNQAIMDFGALVCTPRLPKCVECPLNDGCVACADGRVETLPVKSKRTVVKERYLTYLLFIEENTDGLKSIFLHRRLEGDIWAGLYEPHVVESDKKLSVENVVPSGCCVIGAVEGLKHQLTHRLIHADAYLVKKENNTCRIAPLDGFVCVPLADINRYAAPRLVNIIYERLGLK